MKNQVRTLSELLTNADVFIDGDWIESKDQNPSGDVRLIQLADIGDGFFISKSSRFLTSETAHRLKCTFLMPGDLLVARMPDPLGRACIFPGDMKASITVVDICVIRVNDNELCSKWLMHSINSTFVRNQIADFATGTTRSRVSRGNLGKIQLSVPPLPEQRRIAAILDKAEALRAKRRAALAKLEQLAQSIFLEMFGDPATNPKGFPRVELSTLVRLHDSINYGVVQPGDDLEEGVPLIRAGDIISGNIRTDSLKRISPEIDNQYQRSRLKGDEILVSCVGSIGYVALANSNVAGYNIARAVARIPPSDSVNRHYLAEYLRTKHIQQYFAGELRTVSQPTLNIKQLSETKVILPPLSLQQAFARRIEAVESFTAKNHSSLTKLDALFASIENYAFQGML